jgi:hypothetical protein
MCGIQSIYLHIGIHNIGATLYNLSLLSRMGETACDMVATANLLMPASAHTGDWWTII